MPVNLGALVYNLTLNGRQPTPKEFCVKFRLNIWEFVQLSVSPPNFQFSARYWFQVSGFKFQVSGFKFQVLASGSAKIQQQKSKSRLSYNLYYVK